MFVIAPLNYGCIFIVRKQVLIAATKFESEMANNAHGQILLNLSNSALDASGYRPKHLTSFQASSQGTP